MSAAPIDYDALAQKHGSSVDYDALAQKHGAVNAAPAAASSPEPEGFIHSFLDQTPLSLLPGLAHPEEAVKGIGRSIMNMGRNAVSEGGETVNALKNGSYGAAAAHAVQAVPILGQAMKKAGEQIEPGDDNSSYGGILSNELSSPGALGTIAGASTMLAIPAAKGIAKIGGEPLLNAAGETATAPLIRGGAGLINKAGGTLKSDFSHGANPGLGYLEGGGKPALTMEGLANKAASVRSSAGEQLSPLYDKATASGMRIPADDVFDAVADPVAKLRATAEGFGGVGAPASLSEYEDRLLPPILDASQKGGFTPRGLFDLKRNLAENTRWNDPTKFDLNTVRQQGTGAIGGLLSDAIPEVGPLNRVYQGASNLADRTRIRANTGTPPFADIVHRGLEAGVGAGLGAYTHNPLLAALPLAADSILVKTGLGYGMFHAGKLLNEPISAPPTPSFLLPRKDQ